MESLSNSESFKPNFVFPDAEEQRGEIGRVAEKFSPDNPYPFALRLYESIRTGTLMEMNEVMWQSLDNTDSNHLSEGDWDTLDNLIAEKNSNTGSNRDWKYLRQKIEQGKELYAPIVLKYGDKLHLVSGNTRLMVARALGVTPVVLLVEIE